MRMYKDPVLWPRKSQVTGDIIYLQMANNKLKELIVPKNAIMISQSGPDKAQMFDQIQGNTIKGYFINNSLDSLTAQPNASSIYFVKDDSGAYVGCSEAQSERIEIIFKDEKIQKIYYRKEVSQKMTPMKDVMPTTAHLSRFIWRESERPKTLDSFLKGATLPHPSELLTNPASPEITEGRSSGEEKTPVLKSKPVIENTKSVSQKPVTDSQKTK